MTPDYMSLIYVAGEWGCDIEITPAGGFALRFKTNEGIEKLMEAFDLWILHGDDEVLQRKIVAKPDQGEMAGSFATEFDPTVPDGIRREEKQYMPGDPFPDDVPHDEPMIRGRPVTEEGTLIGDYEEPANTAYVKLRDCMDCGEEKLVCDKTGCCFTCDNPRGPDKEHEDVFDI